MGKWWTEFYDDVVASALLEHDPIRLSKTADFVISGCELAKDNLIFDQCCGQGDLSIALARRGMHTIGIDQSATYIKAAAEKAWMRRLDCRFECREAESFVAPRPCDAAINWHTSFGYYENDDENLQLLLRAYES